MNGDLFTGPTPYDQNPEAAEWLFKVLRGLEAPAHMREAVNGLKEAINLYLTVPAARVQALMRPMEIREQKQSVGVNCPTCGHQTQILATNEKCPLCAKPMVMRRNRTNGQAFLGCSGFPTCRGTINLQSLLVRRSMQRTVVAANGVEEPMRLIEIN
ncbi:hypothetical protein EKK58_01175 [Candidatus Dependentiae bacterium]|nr:MAG: hypothetical protein EKK58_01175 [Candidatus Dependentiae bacterium]